MKCKYCPYEGSIFSLRQHIMKKLICKNKYTQDDLLDFEKLYEPHQKENRKLALANYYQKNKRLKEIKVIVFHSFIKCVIFKSNTTYFRKLFRLLMNLANLMMMKFHFQAHLDVMILLQKMSQAI